MTDVTRILNAIEEKLLDKSYKILSHCPWGNLYLKGPDMAFVHRSLRQRVRGLLLQRIASGKLESGQRIVESKLAKELQISTVPIREALLELTAMGVLESEPFKGARIREVSLQETIEAFEVRAALESLAAQKATRQLKKECRRLRQILKSIITAARKRDFAAFQEHNQVFHRTIVEASGNSMLLKTWEWLAFQVRTKFTMDYLKHEDPVAIAREHEPIIKAIERGDAKRVSTLLSSHSTGLMTRLRQEYDSQLKEEAKSA